MAGNKKALRREVAKLNRFIKPHKANTKQAANPISLTEDLKHVVKNPYDSQAIDRYDNAIHKRFSNDATPSSAFKDMLEQHIEVLQPYSAKNNDNLCAKPLGKLFAKLLKIKREVSKC